MIWVPNAPEGKATEIAILLVGPEVTVTGWPGKKSMNTGLIGSIPLLNGETVWAVHLVAEMPDFSQQPQGRGHFFRDSSRDDLDAERLRALAFGRAPDGSRVIYDFAVRRVS
jgi:hypothetical protein